MTDIKRIVILEGDVLDDEIATSLFEKAGIEWEIIEGLYYNREYLQKLPEMNPDAIYIRTTGLNVGGRLTHRKRLIRRFKALDWIPKNVIFFNDDSAFAYQTVAEQLKKEHGTKIWMIGFTAEKPFTEITWI